MDLSVIIVEYKNIELLEKAILSVNNNISEVKTEIIVVSNSSYPTQKQIEIQDYFIGTKFIFNKNNLGFAKAVNQAIVISSGNLIMLLNPDARLFDNSFLKAVELMRENKKIAVVGPMTLDGEGQLHDTFRRFMSPMALVKRTLKRFRKLETKSLADNKDFHEVQQVDWVSGGCLIASMAAIEASGLLDERYFMYIEDMDWCRRFWLNGYEVWYLPEWKVEHLGSKGSTKEFRITNKLMWIHLISYLKYYFKWLRLSLPLLSFLFMGKFVFK